MNHFSLQSAHNAIHSYHSPYQSEKNSQKLLQNFLTENENISEKNPIFTHCHSSFWLVNADFSKVLFTLDETSQKWCPPSGRIEPNDANFLDSSLRQAKKLLNNSDFSVISPRIFDINMCEFSEKNNKKSHFLYTICHFLQIKNEKFMQNSPHIQWFCIQNLLNKNSDECVQRMAEKTQNFATFSLLLQQNENEDIVDDDDFFENDE